MLLLPDGSLLVPVYLIVNLSGDKVYGIIGTAGATVSEDFDKPDTLRSKKVWGCLSTGKSFNGGVWLP